MSSEEQITNDDIMWALGRAQGFLAGCNIRPETSADRPRSGIPPTVCIDDWDGTAEQRAVKLWQHILKDGAE